MKLKDACVAFLILGAAFGLQFIPAARASIYGSTGIRQDLQSLIAADPAIGKALTASLRKADWKGISTLDQFFDFVDETVRMVPTEQNGLAQIRPFFFMIGQSAELKTNTAFQDWVKRYVATWGDFLDSPASIAGLDTFLKDPALHMEDYYVAPSGWLTFNQFFARNVKPGKRPIAGIGDDHVVVSPADGILKDVLPVTDDSRVVAKGISYSIKDLLAGSPYSDAFAGGLFTHSFQEVSDYHHYHVPFGGKVVEKRNISGPIWLDVAKSDDGALSVVAGDGFQWRQERGLIVLETKDMGLVAILPIGMGHVGSVVLTPDLGAELYKGEQFGFFQFGGSDVVTVFQKDKVKITAKLGQHYRQGEQLGTAAE
ncbi:MAG: phosphatidylserine decarboxylase [Hyphomicrobiales bacterium]